MKRDGDETGTDCGGGTCPACPVGEGCVVGTDCGSLACGANHICVAPECDDMVKNGDETDADCGGSCPPCAYGEHCTENHDCASNECNAGSCTGECTPGMKQCSDTTPQTCDVNGQWQSATPCDFVCSAGSCAGVCSPGAKQCFGIDVQTCDANGAWQTTETCTYVCDAGICAGTCSPGAKQCAGSTVQTCDSNGQWQNGTPCSAGTPYCAAGTCTAPPSCQAGATGAGMDCGPSSNESCCTSLPVSGGTFYRSYDGVSSGYTSQAYPSTVSSFMLDKYEVTVGRFRQFVNAWVAGWRPGAGAGKHGHLNGGSGLSNSASPGTYETGWDTAWEPNLATTKSSWDTNLACDSTYRTWTPSVGSNEKRPINCVTLYEAYAFCIWDGGSLPSEAEWNYAAAGGAEQRAYPWGSTAPGPNATLAIHDCYYNGSGTCTGIANIAAVGSVAMGNGKYGQADLAGNVWEWTLDRYASYVTPCNDCVYQGPSSPIFRGGSFDSSASLLVSFRGFGMSLSARLRTFGMRCARSP